MMRIDDSITATTQRAIYADAMDGLRRRGKASWRASIFLHELEEACIEGGVDFAFAAAHACNEADWLLDPGAVAENNYFGIGHPDNAKGGIQFGSIRAGARFYVGELLLKLRKPIPPSLADARSYAVAKWDQVERIVGGSLGTFPPVRTIADLNTRFGPNNREAVWMTDSSGPQAIVDKGNALFPSLPDQQETQPVPETKFPTILIDAGHRSTDRTGNPAETDLTDDMAESYVDELRRRGFAAVWLQRDVDGDNDPDDVVGDLDTVGRDMAAWAARTPGDLLILSCHYNGAHSPLHAIVPDNRGLTTRVPNGAPADDTAANNVLDCNVGETIVQLMASRGLGGLFHGKLNRPGLMSETETGVGLDGFRLAVFAYTAPHRARAVRLVIEHGGTADPAARRFADFAKTAADAIEAVYGKPSGTPTTTTTAPPKPPSKYAAPITGWMGDDAPGKRTDHTITVTVDGKEERVKVFALERPYEALRGTYRLQGPDIRGPKVGPKLDVRERFTGSYFAVVGSSRWVVTPAGSWLSASALTPRVAVRVA